MPLKSRLRVWAVCLALQMGVLCGVPMRPDEIQEFMHRMNQPVVSHVLPAEEDGSDDDRPTAPDR